MRLLLALLLAPAVLAGDVAGYVYAPDGGVVEGAIVRAGTASVTTKSDGAFAFRDLPEGVVELEIQAKGWATAKPLVLTGDVVTVNLTKDDPSPGPTPVAGEKGDGTIRGTVTVDGKPLANAPVLVNAVRVRTNAKGEYVAKGLPPGRHAVMIDERLFPRLRAPYLGHMYAEGKEPHIADLRTAREAVLDVPLVAAPMMRGRVVDTEGRPVAHARVQLVLANRSALDFAADPGAARTTPDGRFAFPAPQFGENEQVAVAVTPLLHSTVRSRPFVLGNASREVDIALPKLETVRIRVLDRAGEPVAGARVGFASTADTAAFESIELLVEHAFGQRAPRTNAGGELVVQLAADTYDFAAAAEGFQTRSIASKAIAKPATVDITLERAALLRGRVHRAGRGVANVNVNVLGGSSRRATSHVTTDAEGRFEIGGLAPGTYRIGIFKHEELIDRTLDVEAPASVDVALPPSGTLKGRVLDAATGEPVREFAFSVEPLEAGQNTRGGAGVHRGEMTADGTFTVQVPAGTYRVNAGANGFVPAEPVEVRVTDSETTNVELPLSRGITVQGRVTDDSGLPVRGAMVMIQREEAPRDRRSRMNAVRVGPAHAETGEDGTFRLTGVEPGEAQLMVRRDGYVVHRQTIEAEQATSLDVRLTRGLSIRGIVTRRGHPVEGVQVGASSSAIGAEHQSSFTGEDGRFTITGLIPARYTVSAYIHEEHAETRDVDPTQKKEIVITLDAKPHGVIYGVVTGIPPALGGKYVRRVVMANGEEGGAEGTIDDAGNYRIEKAPAGNVTVAAYVETSGRTGRSSLRRQVEVVAGQPLRVDLDLGGNVRVSGRITLEGKPVAGAYVGFSSEDGMTASGQTRDDGVYEVHLPAPGRYHLYARAEQLTDRHFQTVRDVRGGETIDVDLREQVIEGTVVDAVTRQPIAGALVTLAPAAGAVMSIAGEVPADAAGRFRIVTASSGGAHRLVASAAGYEHRVLPVSAATTVYAFELAPASDLGVRVLDSRTGAPLDAHVVVSDATGILPARSRRSGDGTTFLFSVAPGKYTLTVAVHGFRRKVVEVTAPGAIDVVME